jgi:hypothetical protein
MHEAALHGPRTIKPASVNQGSATVCMARPPPACFALLVHGACTWSTSTNTSHEERQEGS